MSAETEFCGGLSEEIKNKKKVNWQDENSELQNVFG
jgi:post-segregation antitoxin (ccd killing protein)